MSNIDYFKTLIGLKCSQKLDSIRNHRPVIPETKKVDLRQIPQEAMDDAWRRLGMCVIVSIFFVSGPIALYSWNHGAALFLSMFPALIFCLSHIIAAYYTYHRGLPVFMASTIGVMPLRLALIIIWMYCLTLLPGIGEVTKVLIFGFGVHMIMFGVVKIIFLSKIQDS